MMSKNSVAALRAEYERLHAAQQSIIADALGYKDLAERLLATLERCQEVAARQESEIVRLRAALEAVP